MPTPLKAESPTTALCIEMLEEVLAVERIANVLDVGTGSGILALAALKMGVPQAVGVDIAADALKVAAENASLNGLSDRLELIHGGADAVTGVWPVGLANVLAAPLIEMAPLLVRRVGSMRPAHSFRHTMFRQIPGTTGIRASRNAPSPFEGTRGMGNAHAPGFLVNYGRCFDQVSSSPATICDETSPILAAAFLSQRVSGRPIRSTSLLHCGTHECAVQ